MKAEGYSATVEEIHSFLEIQYRPPTWSLFKEVFSSVGGMCSRADAVAIAMWRSRGFEVHGVEIKASRSDWLNELRQPAKAEEIFQYCDRWFLVTTNDSVIKPDELPKNWGWKSATKNGLRVKREAAKLNPLPLDRAFVCSIIRQAHAQINEKSDQDGKLLAEYQRGWKDSQKREEETFARERAEHQRVLQMILDFHEASGVAISSWNAGKIGEAVQMVMNGELEHKRGELTRLRDSADEISQAIAAVLAEMNGARKL